MKLFKSFSLKVLALTLTTVLVVGMVPLYANDEINEPIDEGVQYATGWIPDSWETIQENLLTPQEIAEYAGIRPTAALPASVDLTNSFPAPGNQGHQGSCAAWATAYALKSHMVYLERGEPLNDRGNQFSPAYVYNQLATSNGSGLYIYDAMSLIKEQGVCSLESFPYNSSDWETKPTPEQRAEAANYKGRDWGSIFGVDAIKTWLASGKGVVTGIQVYPDFDRLSWDNPIYDSISDRSRGGHAICLVGYDDNKRAFKLINSWGTGWGLDGYGWVSYDLMNNPDVIIYPAAVGYVMTDVSGNNPAPSIKTTILPSFTLGRTYILTLLSTGMAPLTWSLAEGALPPGIHLSRDGGLVGQATTSGTFDFTVRVENPAGSDTKALSITVPGINPTGVTISPKPLTLDVGNNTLLSATILPADATIQTISWRSSNPSVASVDDSGRVTAVDAGRTTITAKTINGLEDTCLITVTDGSVCSLSLARSGSTDPYVFPSLPAGYAPPQSIELTLTNTGEKAISSLHVTRSGANSGSFMIWLGSSFFTPIEPGDTKTITVSPIPGLTPGTYTEDIAVEGNLATSNSFKVTFTVLPARVPVQSVSISGSSTMQLGSTATLGAVVLPANATNTAVSWRSSNTNILTVDANGLVTAVGIGGTWINVTTEDGARSSSLYISVQPKPYSITLDTTAVAFAEVDPGYRAPTARTIRVTNDGTLATGALTVSLSGTNASSFTLSRTTIPSIALRGSATFTVVPRTGLAAGTHTATVTVRGANGIEASFPVSFKVNEGLYSIALDATDVSFPAVDPGYRAPTSRTIRATNTGNQPTGALTASLSGTNATSFILSRTSIASIATGGSATFTVVPRTALAAGTHTATVTVRGANSIERSFTVSFEVRPGIYGITLDATAISFSAVDPGYRAPTSRTIRVTNDGNQPTGALTVSLSGTNATSFSLSRSSIASIARGGSATFTVVPRTALAAGVHTATVTVRGANGIEKSFTVSFEVRPGIYTIDLNATAISFAAVAPGYRAPSAQTVRVTNTGNQATGALTLSLSGANATSFSLSRTSLASIARGGSSTFTVVPRTGLAPGIYEATVNVRGANAIDKSFTVRFVVNAAVYSVALSTTAIDFPAANAGYRAQSAQTVRVTNDGNQATGTLTLSLSGTNAASFTLSRTSLTSIAVGGSSTFTVVPRTGLAAGSYEALVTVRGANGISESFTVSFTVR